MEDNYFDLTPQARRAFSFDDPDFIFFRTHRAFFSPFIDPRANKKNCFLNY